jgi:hypothetical protein
MGYTELLTLRCGEPLDADGVFRLCEVGVAGDDGRIQALGQGCGQTSGVGRKPAVYLAPGWCRPT